MAKHGADWVHPFEVAGLGKAPFRFVGSERRVYQACPGAPIQPGTSCDYCGTGIMYVAWVQGKDGKKFKVGLDCAMRTEDTKLIAEARKAHRAFERTRNQMAKQAVKAELAASAQERQGDVLARLDAQAERATWGARIAKDMAQRLREGETERLSPKQSELLARIERLDEGNVSHPMTTPEPEPDKPESQHFGQVGKRIPVTLTIERFIDIGGQFGGYLIVLRDEHGNRGIWKTSSHIRFPGDHKLVVGSHRGERYTLRRGETFKALATVKKHTEFRGERQTELTRVKATEVLDWLDEEGNHLDVRFITDRYGDPAYFDRNAAESDPEYFVKWKAAKSMGAKKPSPKPASRPHGEAVRSTSPEQTLAIMMSLPSSKAKSPKKPTPRRASPKRLLITDPDALAKLAIVEGNPWADRQRKGGVNLDNSFFLNKRAFELKVEHGLGNTDIPLAELDPAAGVIVGEDGWRSYIVMPDGEIMFDGASTTNDFFRDSAASFMQVI
jgi:hypothetical protein